MEVICIRSVYIYVFCYTHFIIIVLSGLLLLSNCSKKITIGFLMDDSKTGRWVKDKELFMQSIEKMGGEVIFKSSEGDADKQLELANEILAGSLVPGKTIKLTVVDGELNVSQ